MIEATRLSALIASRICHDLVSPVTSLTTALGILEDETAQEMQDQAQNLLNAGANQMQARLKFMRFAFGSAGLSSGVGDIYDAKQIINDFVESHKPSLQWELDGQALSFMHLRLIMHLVMLAVECLPRGGVIDIRTDHKGERMDIIITSTGNRAKMRIDMQDGLIGKEPEEGWTARTVQPYCALELVKELGGRIETQFDEDVVTLRVYDLNAEIS